MPGASGRDLVDRLATTRPAMKVLYMSGYTDHAIVHHGVLDPGVAYIPKPFTPDEVARKVRAVLDEEAGPSEARRAGTSQRVEAVRRSAAS